MDGLRDRALGLLLGSGLLLSIACAGPPTAKPVTRAEKASLPSPAIPPTLPEPAPQPPPPAVVEKVPPGRDGSVVVVESGEEEKSTRVGLVEASRAEKERRSKAGPPIAVITDKNLAEYARKGQVTISAPSGKDKKGQAAAAAAPAGEPLRDERYWRSRVLEIRQSWRQAADEVKDLEQSAAELRQKFYSESDYYVRDTQVKPEWDRVLERLDATRSKVETKKIELSELLEEGRRAGALPGWLREGVEQEPVVEESEEEIVPHQSIEPPIVDPPQGA